MRKNPAAAVSAVLAVVISIAVFYRISTYRAHFDKVVHESLKTSDGYDQAFIDMVNRLEHELALRASFGYSGEKDPMTGQVRSIVRIEPAPVYTAKPKSLPGAVKKAEVKPPIPSDPFRLSAIIYDEGRGKYTAIVMLGERSMSVEVGDFAAGRTIRSITENSVEMVDASSLYIYDKYGKKEKKPLNAL